MNEPMGTDRRLNSWKEIAAYFGHDQRTVKRWEHSRGLPVRRLPGTRSHVFALVSELEAWQRGELIETEKVHSELVELRQAEAAAPSPTTIRPEEPLLPAGVFNGPEPERSEASSVSPAVRSAGRFPRIAFAVAVGVALLTFLAVGLLARSRRAVLASRQPIHVPEPRAKELYLDGRFRWSRRTPDDLRAALEDFRQAVEIDPGYAAAYAGLADCYALAPQFAGEDENSTLPEMLMLAQKAVTLDPNLSEGHRALAFADFYWRWDREASRAEFEKAIALAPGDAVAHLWFANTLATLDLPDQALAQVERARELNPTEPAIVADRGWVLLTAGRKKEGRAVLENLERTNPENRMAPLWLSWLAYNEHRPEDFLTQFRAYTRLSADRAAVERLEVAQKGLKAGGEPAMHEALLRLAMVKGQAGPFSPYAAAVELEHAGRPAESLLYLQKAFATRDVAVQAITSGREFSSLRGTPAFEEMLQRVQRHWPDSGS